MPPRPLLPDLVVGYSWGRLYHARSHDQTPSTETFCFVSMCFCDAEAFNEESYYNSAWPEINRAGNGNSEPTDVLPDLTRPVCEQTPAVRAFIDRVVEKCLQPLYGWTLLHQAAIEGRLHEMSGISAEDFSCADMNGDTPLHEAAYRGLIDLVPKHLLTAEGLRQPSQGGFTPAHFIARNGQIDQLPAALITWENFCIRDAGGYAAADHAFLTRHAWQLAGVFRPRQKRRHTLFLEECDPVAHKQADPGSHVNKSL